MPTALTDCYHVIGGLAQPQTSHTVRTYWQENWVLPRPAAASAAAALLDRTCPHSRLHARALAPFMSCRDRTATWQRLTVLTVTAGVPRFGKRKLFSYKLSFNIVNREENFHFDMWHQPLPMVLKVAIFDIVLLELTWNTNYCTKSAPRW